VCIHACITAAIERCSSRMMPMACAGGLGSPVDDTSTGSPACISTCSVSDASAMPRRPRWPCEAMKIRSQPLSRAAATMAVDGLSPGRCSELQGTPSACAAASALASSSRALPV
jgi:hypothetical protein